MDPFHSPWFNDLSGRQWVTGEGLAQARVFLLVAVRLAGCFCVGPFLGRTLVSWPVRIGLVVLLTLIVAPSLTAADPGNDPASPSDLILAMACDAGIGAALGLSVAVFLTGLKLGGAWLDRHGGLGLGSVLNPEYSPGDSAPAELLSLFCVVVLLVLQPVNGHLLVVRFILDTFHALPVGMMQLPGSAWELLRAIVQQALVLGLRVAMPFAVAMSLLDLTLSWIRRSSRWELTSVAQAMRVGAGLLILAATFPGIQEAAASTLYESLKIAHEEVQADSPHVPQP
ncbi:MAG: flagellar biosynthetic protein FliR [Planctomycetes bacterium]|nr:flagellar biosynthetic protein FliR [Planctomycetota bacterium]